MIEFQQSNKNNNSDSESIFCDDASYEWYAVKFLKISNLGRGVYTNVWGGEVHSYAQIANLH